MKKQVVIVDDEPHILDAVERILANEDFDIVTFTRARDAIKFVQDCGVDVVVTDIMMPGIKGVDLCSELKKINPFIQFIVITGYASKDIVESLLRIGIADILVKPFKFDELKLMIHSAFQRVDRLAPLREL